MKARVFSGVQPSGQLHIGNYLGALKNWAEIQDRYESIFCIVDLHAITVYQPPEELSSNIRETAALFIAAGIDPEQSSIVVQSSISGHAELAWLLTCVTPLGWLQRMTQFKAKADKQETVGDGILQYPVLMAADILLYQASIVPVGEDQAQHLEFARDLAQRFNSLYGDTFVMPATHLPAVGARIMGLDDPTQKMSMPLGVVASDRPRAGRAIVGIAAALQVVPSLALFGLLLPVPFIGGIGARSAVVALVLYALLPIVRGTIAGIAARCTWASAWRRSNESNTHSGRDAISRAAFTQVGHSGSPRRASTPVRQAGQARAAGTAHLPSCTPITCRS
jgi:hypothetical protein